MIEAIGCWIWVTGNTKSVRIELKQARFFFAYKKCAWYYRSEEYKTRGGKKSLEEIRHKYGSELVQTKTQASQKWKIENSKQKKEDRKKIKSIFIQ